jgi:hypothetical protein
MDDTTIKEQVRERYGNLARQRLKGQRGSCCDSATNTASSCCTPSDVLPR